MASQNVPAIVLLVFGVVLLVVGISSSNSIADQFANTFTGHFTDKTTWYILGGVVLGVIGLVMLVRNLRGRHA